jgi:penicillin-binding protein 2
MVSNPDYTPQVLYDGISSEQLADYNDRNIWVNKAIQGTYEPGSTYKMITAIAGLETGAITTTDRINDTGVYPLNASGVQNPVCWIYTSSGNRYGHGYLNVTGALAKSCNFFFYEVGMRVGIDGITPYAKHFGLGVKTGIELNSEASGLLATRDSQSTWSAADTVRAAIGQSNNIFTPIQMAKYIAMVANGGKNIDVTIVKDVINSDGTTVSDSEIEEFVNKELNLTVTSTDDDGLTVSEETLAVVREGMRSVAEEEGGTAFSVFNDFPIEIGGKTGSAEATDGNGNELINAWFVGFAPYDNPQIAVVVVVENGGHGFYAGNVVKAIMQEYFGTDRTGVTEDMSIESEMEYLN